LQNFFFGMFMIRLFFYNGDTQFFSFTQLDNQITIYLSTDHDFNLLALNHQDRWCQFKVNEGELGFQTTGIVQSIAAPLCVARIAIIYISTYETDYTFVRELDLKSAILQLEESGWVIQKQIS